MPNIKQKDSKLCWCGKPSDPPKWKLCGWVCPDCDRKERLQHASEAHARYQELVKKKTNTIEVNLFEYRLSGL